MEAKRSIRLIEIRAVALRMQARCRRQGLLSIAGTCLVLLTPVAPLDAKVQQPSLRSLTASIEIANYPGELYLPVAHRVASQVVIEGEPIHFVLRLGNGDETEREVVFSSNDFSRNLAWTARRDDVVISLSPEIRPETRHVDRQQNATIEWKPRLRLGPAEYLEWFTAPLAFSAGNHVLYVTILAADERGQRLLETGFSFPVVPRTLDVEAEIARRAVMRDILSGSFDDARDGVARFLQVHPNSVAAYQMLGLIAEMESSDLVGKPRDEKRAEADVAYRRALALVDSDAIIRETASSEGKREIADGLARRSFRMGGVWATQPVGK